eukprot:gene4312-6110_t
MSRRHIQTNSIIYKVKLIKTPNHSIFNKLVQSIPNNQISRYFCSSSSSPHIPDESTSSSSISEKSLQSQNFRRSRKQKHSVQALYNQSSLLQCIKERDFEGAMLLYEQMIKQETRLRANLFNNFIGLCEKYNHLPKVLDIIKDMEKFNLKPNEQVYTALIRCYSDGGNIEKAYQILQTMLNNSIELKLRTISPVFDVLCEQNNGYGALFMLDFMMKNNITPQGKQLTTLVQMIDRIKPRLSTAFQKKFDRILEKLSDRLLGLTNDELKEIAGSIEKLSMSQVEEKGILVQSMIDIPGIIVTDSNSSEGQYNDNNNSSNESSFIAMTATVESLYQQQLAREEFQCQTIAVVDNADVYSSNFTTEKFIVLDKLDDTLKNEFKSNSARLIGMSSKSCFCPNCDGKLIKFSLTDEERQKVKSALLTAAYSISDYHGKSLEKEDFDYIVDGANVAYYHQNFVGGRFSYRQIELVVKQLQMFENKRILVILPKCYTQKVIPNSIRKDEITNKTVTLSDEDLRILAQLKNDDMIYTVPQGSNDDWYWTYSTVHKKRLSSNPIFVITNDLMRDHKIAFMEPRPFIRWRSSSIIYFKISSAVTPLSYSPTVSFEEPGKYSQEIQVSNSKRWHVPCIDRRGIWLCMNSDLSNHQSYTVNMET